MVDIINVSCACCNVYKSKKEEGYYCYLCELIFCKKCFELLKDYKIKKKIHAHKIVSIKSFDTIHILCNNCYKKIKYGMGCSLCKYILCYFCFLNIEKKLNNFKINNFILLFQNQTNNFDNINIIQLNDYFNIICHDFKKNFFFVFSGTKNYFLRMLPMKIIKSEINHKISMIKYYNINKINNKFCLIYSFENNIYVYKMHKTDNHFYSDTLLKKFSSKNKEFSFCYINMNNENNLLIADEKTKKILLYNELKYIGEIGCSYENGKDIETFIDNDNRCFIIISGNGLNNYTKSYLLFEKNYYQIYKKKNHYPLKNIIEKINEKLVLIESSIGYVVIFDFHKGDIINIIKTEEDNIEEKSIILELCLWNENNLLCGNDNGEIFIFDINNNKIIFKFKAHEDEIKNIKKIKFENYERLITSTCNEYKIWLVNYKQDEYFNN